MATLFRAIKQRSSTAITLDGFVEQFKYLQNWYPLGLLNQTITGDTETIDQSFSSYVQGIYQANGVVFACAAARLRLFQQARFIFRDYGSRRSSGQRDGERGTPGKLFGTRDLRILEQPWPNGNTHDLLARCAQDADLSGNAFFWWQRDGRKEPRLRRLRPDWVTIALGSDENAKREFGDIDAEVVGYVYTPGGIGSGKKPVPLDVDDVVHFAPYPDPFFFFRGMSWLTPIIRNITAHSAATSHKLKFFENGATPNMIVKLDPTIPQEEFDQWVDTFDAQHTGYLNAYKTLYFGGGADASVVGTDLKQMDFKATQGTDETAICSAAGVPAVLVGISEGLQAATYSNYGQARRSMADMTAHPWWQNACGSFEKIVKRPAGAELWYDTRGIPFLQEDQKDAADIQQTKAATIQMLVNAGYRPESVVAAVNADDMNLLEHTGLFSVQLQEPGTQKEVPDALAP